MNSNLTQKKSGEPCVSGKYIDGKCLKAPGEKCNSKVDCASGKCINGKCLADVGWRQSLDKNRFLLNSTYSESKSPSPEQLKQIRRKKVEPYNTGKYHPITYYIILGHGGENTKETNNKVPKGCILVVKSQSGNLTTNTDFTDNVKQILDTKNKESVFDPVSHRKELFTLLTADSQHTKKDITASHSTAIYREGDTYNNFTYQPLNVFINSSKVSISGIYKSDNSGESLSNEIATIIKYDNKSKVFLKDDKTNICTYITKLDIPSLFKYSNAYTYYYTKEHIQDILDIILEYVNLQKDGYIIMTISETILIDKHKDKYMKIKKGYIYVPGEYQNSPADTILTEGIDQECINIVSKEEIDLFKALATKNIKDDPRNKWVACLQNMTLERLLIIIAKMTVTTQADLFNDVEQGLIQPGIFYNLICRSTINTTVSSILDFDNSTSGQLKRTYIDSKNSIKVHNIVPEIKTRITEAEHQGRKEQAKAFFNNMSATLNNTSTVDTKYIGINSKNKMIDYIRYVENQIQYKSDINTESVKIYTDMIYITENNIPGIKLYAFKYLLMELQDNKEKLMKLQDNNENIKFKIKNINNILSNYYSKKALLAENKEISDKIIKGTNKYPYTIEFLQGKIQLNNMFINKYIKPQSSQPLNDPLNDPLNEFVIPQEKNIKILTNNYKNYRNTTGKFYNRVINMKDGKFSYKWVEQNNALNKTKYNKLSKARRTIEGFDPGPQANINGGKRVTRKCKKRKRNTRKRL